MQAYISELTNPSQILLTSKSKILYFICSVVEAIQVKLLTFISPAPPFGNVVLACQKLGVFIDSLCNSHQS